tara:strand:+ start:4830 stop:5189 length:360 start_codon:yes stop_codon:yes gene_type:complete
MIILVFLLIIALIFQAQESFATLHEYPRSGVPNIDEKVRVSETYLVGTMTFPEILTLDDEEEPPLWGDEPQTLKESTVCNSNEGGYLRWPRTFAGTSCPCAFSNSGKFCKMQGRGESNI